MSKKRFIQSVIARSLPSADKREAALAYAEELWSWLTDKGYGDDKPHEPRISQDWYKLLSDMQRRYFDAFWIAFNYKKGRNEAAMRWYQLGELSQADYQRIIDAADKEAKQDRPVGTVRKHAEGWLHAKRFYDYTPVKPSAKSAHNLALATLKNKLAGVKLLYERGKDPALLKQIEQLERAISEAEHG